MDNFIEIYKNVLSDDYCNKLIDYFNAAEVSGLTLSRQEHDGILKTEKEDLAFFILSFPLNHSDKYFVEEFNRVFWGHCYKQYAEKYNILNTCDKHTSYSIKVQKTKPGQGYHVWHCEAANRDSANRILAWTAYLNDDFEAGETEFLYQQYRYKPNKGDVVIFPAAFTHTHRGNPPIGGNKYIITGWIEF